jgi:hypothetical protein
MMRKVRKSKTKIRNKMYRESRKYRRKTAKSAPMGQHELEKANWRGTPDGRNREF